MDDNLKLFENPDFGDVRVLLDEKHEPCLSVMMWLNV